MDRRSFFAAGATAAAVGTTGITVARATGLPASSGGMSIVDFGAVGDGVTDDSAAFNAALKQAASYGRVIFVPGLTYAIARPIVFSSTQDAARSWGLRCDGATLVSRLAGSADVVTLIANNTVRYFRLTGGLSIVGSGQDGNGLRLFAPGGTPCLYNMLIEGLSVERVGGHGLLFEGNVFEGTVQNSYFQDCGGNGATFAHSCGGVVSAINVNGCYFSQNGGHGLAATNFDGEYGGTTDVRVHGGYCRDNHGYGFYYNNGTGAGAIEQVGFENNCRGLAPGDPNGAHVYGLSSMYLRNCSGHNMHGGATYLLRGWFSGLTVLEGCAQSAAGAAAATGATRLVQINGNAQGHVRMRNCNGGIDVAPGSACSWAAESSAGPTPRGMLSYASALASA
ncbi:MAG: hypothetical protein J0H82_02680 [Alphaproteobacteria bacterium]|nr:hypothetical protein [Alphaproteobacteria bacterium]